VLVERLLGADWFSRGLAKLSWPANQELLAWLCVVEAFVRPYVARRVIRWTRAQPGDARVRLALSVAANHGRFLAKELLLTGGGRAAALERCRFQGLEHLDHAPAGALLLGFHLGPPVVPLALHIRGYPLHVWGGVRIDPRRGAAWARFLAPGEDPFIRVSGGHAVANLHRARQLLLEGKRVFVPVDGKGRPAFVIPTPPRAVALTTGWLALRRHARPTSLPVIAHRDGPHVVVTVYPPLPAVDPDPERDLWVCRDRLSAIVREFASRLPAQCRPPLF
jgi:hypothetical protein